ncbi:hypothetical protein TAJ_50 [Mycobacterium phage Taj]|uniref:Uncharacterized protein n=2 Tax=Gracegardnervirinae TaxID=2946632 RepID=A0A385E2J8_9CAUD|nr:hypothetical protein TAJ_50 [Mycobacterium phage Taj]YP_009841076.1 hypothetical protein HWB85_gp051 [Mycobacterium phage Renaud18]AFO10174.1 hypothetical protein TAJ_50 [Mycobacterium phage Taj]AXQ64959.1 hypothetical protein SEA_RENAUD18_51 [Mycobacterium phage Renaud18]QGH77866.1 hypothetical protein SEA_KENUHA5_44 [Mycobacterium phage Kenuha5]
MTAARLGSEWRELVKLAALLGFDEVQVTKRGHPRFYNRDIDRFYVASFTPSDWRSRKNAVGEMERMSGRKVPRQKAGKIRHQQAHRSNLRMTAREQAASTEADDLEHRAEELRSEIADLIAEGTNAAYCAAAPRAREFADIRLQLEQRYYRIIPPLSA